jgi:hypothetical protein
MKFRYDSLAIAVALGALAGGVACDRMTSPSPATATPAPPAPVVSAPAPTVIVSGTVWVHTTNGVKPMAGGRLSGWIEHDRSGWTTGWITLDGSGRYSVSAPAGSLVRIFAGDPYQPCEMRQTNLTTAVTRDVHVVGDLLQLGARLPAELLNDAPILSGIVFEAGSGGTRPVGDVQLELDGFGRMGVVTARTRTDSDGRYVFCGLGGEMSTYLYAIKGGHIGFEGTVQLNGATDTRFDVEFGR